VSAKVFNINNVYFLDTKKNIIMDGNFTKIIYSVQTATLNSVYIEFPIQKTVHKPQNKNMIYFSLLNQVNINIIKNLNRIEHDIIEHFKTFYNITKINVYSLKDQLKCGCVKIYYENTSSYFSESDSRKNGFFGMKRDFYSLSSSGLCDELKIFADQEAPVVNPVKSVSVDSFVDAAAPFPAQSTRTQNQENARYVIKISGIWENINSIGITYKVMEVVGGIFEIDHSQTHPLL
jgi:hypothetical protein